jgi:hypothetical protein
MVGWALGAAYLAGGESGRSAVFDALYRPLAAYLAHGDPGFDMPRFAAVVEAAELEHRESERAAADDDLGPGVVRLLRTEPTAEERYSHAARLLAAAAGAERRRQS